MSKQPMPVIMVSSVTQEGASATIRALMLGAVDCVAKPSQFTGTKQMVTELANKIREVGGAGVRRMTPPVLRNTVAEQKKASVRPLRQDDAIIAIGSSTGGPGALRQLLENLSADLNAAVVIVQHMPPGFTRSLADNLDHTSAWSVKEASKGDRLLVGQALLAPGGFHLNVGHRGEIVLTQEPPVNHVRPAVDVTMCTVAKAYGKRVLGIVLTGMGRDGTKGAVAIHQAGGQIIAEAKSTCAVYGMPRSVVEAGVADYVAPLPEIPALAQDLLRESKK